MSDYAKALTELYGLVRVGEKYSLDGPRAIESALRHPLTHYKSILVGGTNGKGSTSICLSTLLQSGGVKVGLFTSPHLVSFRERIRINGTPISEAETVGLIRRVLPFAEKYGSSFFEAAWGMAALAFQNADVDIVIWEVGLGGRLDATNVCEPIGSIVTNVALDHMAILGNSRTEIAYEKAAIFRPQRPALTGCKTSQPLLNAHTKAEVVYVPTNPDLSVGLAGAHQQHNASLAIELLSRLALPFDPNSLKELRWSGRMERHGSLLVDSAHNPHALSAALVTAKQLNALDGRPLEIIFGVMADKNVDALSGALVEAGYPIHLVEPSYPRRLPLDALRDLVPSTLIVSSGIVPDCLAKLTDDKQYLVVGSSFLAAEVIAHVRRLPYPECGIVTTAR